MKNTRWAFARKHEKTSHVNWYYHCYGYIKIGAFRGKRRLSVFVWFITGVLLKKYFTRSLRSLILFYFLLLFLFFYYYFSAWPRSILYIASPGKIYVLVKFYSNYMVIDSYCQTRTKLVFYLCQENIKHINNCTGCSFCDK